MQRLIIIDDIEVDIDAIYSISHNCRGGICTRRKCCCSNYEICIDDQELSVITGWLPLASQFSPGLKTSLGLDNIFDESDPGLFALDTDEHGLCVFAYPTKENQILCSLHSAALHMGLPPREVKPKACFLWPLAITEHHPINLSVDEDALSFKCNEKRMGNYQGLCSRIAHIIKDVFGEKFLREVEKCR